MVELPELTPEYFEILVVRELRKVGLEVSALSLHRRSTQVHAEPGYLLELKGVVSRADWLPAYCAQLVGRDIAGQPHYRLLETGQGDLILDQLRTNSREPGL